MKVVKKASGGKKLKISKKEWQNIGKKAGWLKIAQEVLDDIYEKHKMQRTDKPVYVSLYEISRAYGGPEEGGWWYDEHSLKSTKKFYDREEAEEFADLLNDEIEENGLNEELLSSARGFENLPEAPEASGSIYPEGYIPLGFSGDAKNYAVVVEDNPGQSETKERPRYE